MLSVEKVSNIFIPIIIFLAMIGLADATYLTVVHYTGTDIFCNVLNECDIVTTSPYSKILGIPVALLGSIYYFAVFALAIAFSFLGGRKSTRKKILNTITMISPIGFLASLWFVYLQLFVINAICFYCMVSATSSTLIFLIALFLYYKKVDFSTGIDEGAEVVNGATFTSPESPNQ